MKPFLTLFLFICFSLFAQAQIQFWNIADVEDGQWIIGRKYKKIKQLKLYRTDEFGKRLDPSNPGEIQEYNNNGQLTVRIRYKYDWPSKKWNLLAVDSFFYNGAGLLTAYRSYEGPYRNPVYESQVKYNNKNQQLRQDHYTLSGGERKTERYEIFEYDPKGLPKKLTTYNPDKSIDMTRQFFFSPAGKLIKTISVTSYDTNTENFTWSDKGELLSYRQLFGKELQKTVNYTYDNFGRRIKKQTTTPSNYDDFTDYMYDANTLLLLKTYLQYSGTGGKTDRKHEYTEMENAFYE